jgi:hypothetical protein
MITHEPDFGAERLARLRLTAEGWAATRAFAAGPSSQ